MENPSTSVGRGTATAKDFFLHLGAVVCLYATAIALVNLLFTVINYAYPRVTGEYYYSYSPSISLPIATLIVIFPLFVLLSRAVHKIYDLEPEKRSLAVRRWLTYITLFVAGGVLAGDLVTVIYKFLDGQDLTAAFLLKAFVVLLVTAGIFKFYLDEIKDTLTSSKRNVWAIIATLAILISIILGFWVIGTPATQRARRYDEQRTSDLQSVQWQVINYWQKKAMLPQDISELNDPLSSYSLPVDPQTSEPYTYKRMGDKNFELCANFSTDSTKTQGMMNVKGIGRPYPMMEGQENWKHSMGMHCFSRTIDSSLYPPVKF